MKKIYYLKTCNTCQSILKEINLNGVELQEIKQNCVTAPQLEQMHALAGSYETLFSKRAQKYQQLGLKQQNLTEADYKKFLLEHYTFLKRPVAIIDNGIFIGNSKSTIANLTTKLAKFA